MVLLRFRLRLFAGWGRHWRGEVKLIRIGSLWAGAVMWHVKHSEMAGRWVPLWDVSFSPRSRILQFRTTPTAFFHFERSATSTWERDPLLAHATKQHGAELFCGRCVQTPPHSMLVEGIRLERDFDAEVREGCAGGRLRVGSLG